MREPNLQAATRARLSSAGAVGPGYSLWILIRNRGAHVLTELILAIHVLFIE